MYCLQNFEGLRISKIGFIQSNVKWLILPLDIPEWLSHRT